MCGATGRSPPPEAASRGCRSRHRPPWPTCEARPCAAPRPPDSAVPRAHRNRARCRGACSAPYPTPDRAAGSGRTRGGSLCSGHRGPRQAPRRGRTASSRVGASGVTPPHSRAVRRDSSCRAAPGPRLFRGGAVLRPEAPCGSASWRVAAFRGTEGSVVVNGRRAKLAGRPPDGGRPADSPLGARCVRGSSSPRGAAPRTCRRW